RSRTGSTLSSGSSVFHAYLTHHRPPDFVIVEFNLHPGHGALRVPGVGGGLVTKVRVSFPLAVQ
ncbi:MAG: hypothetical protein RR655_04400, partial [Raoultibacter sp.]